LNKSLERFWSASFACNIRQSVNASDSIIDRNLYLITASSPISCKNNGVALRELIE
jgi:hypothetical protein